MSLLVAYATDTGHVLGALSPTGAVGTAATLTELVGAELPLWVGGPDGEPIPLPVPQRYLGVAVVTDQAGVASTPLAFGVEVVGTVVQPELRLLRPVTVGAQPPLLPPDGGVTVTVTAGGVTVALPAPAEDETAVLLLVTGEAGTRPVVLDSIDKNTTGRTFTMTLEPGAYGVLALVAGWRGVTYQAVVP